MADKPQQQTRKPTYFDYSKDMVFVCGKSKNKYGHVIPATDNKRPLQPDPRANPDSENEYDPKLFGPTREYEVMAGTHFLTSYVPGEAPIPVVRGGRVRLTAEQAKRHPDKFRLIAIASDYRDEHDELADEPVRQQQPVNSGGDPSALSSIGNVNVAP